MFLVRPITTDCFRSAYAVLQMTGASEGLTQFRRRVATGRVNGPRGMMAGVFDRRDYIHALFMASIERSMPSRLHIFDFRHGDQIAATFMVEMIDAIEQWAATLGCDQIAVAAANVSCGCHRSLTDVLVSLGFSGETTVLARRL